MTPGPLRLYPERSTTSSWVSWVSWISLPPHSPAPMTPPLFDPLRPDPFSVCWVRRRPWKPPLRLRRYSVHPTGFEHLRRSHWYQLYLHAENEAWKRTDALAAS